MPKKNEKRTKLRKPTPRRTLARVHTPTKTKTNALAHRSTEPLAPVGLLDGRVLTDDVNIGMLGIVECKFTPEEEAVLAEHVPEDEIRIKPTKTGAIYLSHPSYTRWFNRAFGRAGWALVPSQKPMLSNNTALQPYVLYVHGKAIAYAMGEQEYQPSNKEQTYGDVLEGTNASALRRCAKRLGIGLELWDREWSQDWLHKFGVLVKVNKAKRGQPEDIAYQWRRKVDRPFWNEIDGRHNAAVPESDRPPARQERAPARAQLPAASNPKADHPITTDMLTQLWTRARATGRPDEDIKTWLARDYNLTSSRDIKRKDYEDIIRSIEHPGPLSRVIDMPAQGEER